MQKKFKIVKIDSNYCDFLRKYDNRVVYNAGDKKLRPFIGVLFEINNCEYFAPLSSPKIKHLKMNPTIDFLKIDDGKLGAINLNNMIPVQENNYEVFNLNIHGKNLSENKRIILLKNQLRWLTANKIDVLKKSYLLYNLYINNKLTNNVKNRCCNFLLLEKKCQEYNKIVNYI